jgi:hypothetical protein
MRHIPLQFSRRILVFQIRLNQALADDVIYKLRAILISVHQVS